MSKQQKGTKKSAQVSDPANRTHRRVGSESRPDEEASPLRRRQFPCHCAKVIAMPASLNNHALRLANPLSLSPSFWLDCIAAKCGAGLCRDSIVGRSSL